MVSAMFKKPIFFLVSHFYSLGRYCSSSPCSLFVFVQFCCPVLVVLLFCTLTVIKDVCTYSAYKGILVIIWCAFDVNPAQTLSGSCLKDDCFFPTALSLGSVISLNAFFICKVQFLSQHCANINMGPYMCRAWEGIMGDICVKNKTKQNITATKNEPIQLVCYCVS